MTKSTKTLKNDKRTGFLLGLILPLSILFIFYQFTKASLNFEEYLGFLSTFKVLTSIIALSALANLAAFFLALKKNYYETARGLIFSTILITVAVAIYKIN